MDRYGLCSTFLWSDFAAEAAGLGTGPVPNAVQEPVHLVEGRIAAVVVAVVVELGSTAAAAEPSHTALVVTVEAVHTVQRHWMERRATRPNTEYHRRQCRFQ